MGEAHQHEDAERPESPITRLCRKLDEVKSDIGSLRRDIIGDDAESVSRSMLTRIGVLEARQKTLEDRIEKGQSRFTRIVDNVAGSLIISVVVFLAGTMVVVKSLPADAAAKLNSIPSQSK